MSEFTEEKMRARKADLDAQVAAIEAKSGPMREERDEFVRGARAQEDELNAAIKKVEAGLFDKKQEIGRLARALGGHSFAVRKA